MSTGTENIALHRAFDPGTHWDAWVRYPFFPGYAMVGIVDCVGAGVDGFHHGQRVACRSSHSSLACIDGALACPIPESLAWEEAVWFAFAKIAFHGAQVGGFSLGSGILIIGAGPIGQMAVRWAAAAGARHIACVDPVESRLAFARLGGATATISQPIAEARAALLGAFGQALPPIVVDTTGNAAVLQAALGLVADFGRVVLLGDTGSPAAQTLSRDVITRGLAIVGAHDVHMNATWNNRSISELFFALQARGRFPLAGLISHRFEPADCIRAYELANRERAATMGILFDWNGMC